MSSALQIEVIFAVHGHWLKHVWFLKGAEAGCFVQLAVRMQPRTFAPGELPERKHFYVIQRELPSHPAIATATQP